MALLSTYNVGELKMNIALRKERLMEIAEDCFYKYGSYAITVPLNNIIMRLAVYLGKSNVWILELNAN